MNPTDCTLQVMRLGRLLENARELVGLLEDAREKREGDFILDRQYVSSLIDRTVEKLGALVFDAYVLTPGARDRLYEDHDGLRSEAASLQERVMQGGRAAGGEEHEEYALLDAYIAWMKGKKPETSVRGFVGRIVDRVFEELGKSVPASVVGGLPFVEVPGTGVVVRVLDMGGGLDVTGTGRLDPGHVTCGPLRLLIHGDPEEEASRPGPGAGRASWLAFTSGEHLSLRGPIEAPRLFMEATLQGRGGMGLVLMYSPAAPGPQSSEALQGFSEEPTPAGRVAWRLGDPAVEMRAVLASLGRRIFA